MNFSKTIKAIFFLVIFNTGIYAQEKKTDTYKLFYLGGQSNMDGYGFNKDLPEELNKKFNDVYIFHGNLVPDDDTNGGIGKWDNLKPGHGIGFSSNEKINNLSDRFGLELSFAKRLQELYPNEKIVIIKYSKFGTSIDSLASNNFGCWDPDYKGKNGINQYDNFLKTVKNALKVLDINNDGKDDILIPSGILWMQGESDSDKTEAIALKYQYNLKRLMDLIRATFLNNELPIVIGKISDSGNDLDGRVWDYGDLVQYAQEKFVKNDKKSAIIRQTEQYKYQDKYHYDSDGYIKLGREFANQIFKLNN